MFTVDDFLAESRFSTFNSLDVDTIASELAYVTLLVPDSALCPDELDEGRKLYLAHLLTLPATGDLNGRAMGAISSISASQGSQSVSFGAIDASKEDNRLSETPWGLRYLALRRVSACNIATGFVIGGGYCYY